MLLDEDVERVKSSVNMVQLAECYGFKINRQGYIICPFHNDKHPSMQVFSGYTSKDGFYCRSCGAGGTIFSFVMEYENLTFEESVRKIAAMFSITLSEAGGKPPPEERSKYRTRRLISKTEKLIQETNRLRMIELSEIIRLYENLLQNAKPYGELFCYLANKLPLMEEEWEWRFNLLCTEK